MTATRNSQFLRTISLLVTICLFSLSAKAQYGGGSGEPNYPYLIYTAEQMNAVGANQDDWDKHFILMPDVDLSTYTGTDFNIIGYYVDWDDNKPFTGVFDGEGKTISNFSYTSTDKDYIGLLGHVSGVAEIKDLGLIAPNIDGGTGNYVGALIGLSAGTITGCYVESGSASGDRCVGGLVGYNRGGTINNCYSSVNVYGDAEVGGLVGEN